MKELRDILEAYTMVVERGEQAVLASVIYTAGSTYRHAGAKALILANDWVVSLVSGGCLESDLVKQAKQVRVSGVSTIVRYDHSENEDIVWGLGLGCAGIVDVLLERVDRYNPGPLHLIRDVINTREPGFMATVIASTQTGIPVGARCLSHRGKVCLTENWSKSSSLNQQVLDVMTESVSQVIQHEGVDVLVETVKPLIRLLVFGGGADAVPLVAIAAELGWYIEVFDKRSAYATVERFPAADTVIQCCPSQLAAKVSVDSHTIAVVMTHNYMQDLELLEFLLGSSATYIGVLGPKRRLQLLLGDLQKEGCIVSKEHQTRLHGPAGLDIGADSAEEIALSIVSEIQAVLKSCSGGLLRDKTAPIHSMVN